MEGDNRFSRLYLAAICANARKGKRKGIFLPTFAGSVESGAIRKEVDKRSGGGWGERGNSSPKEGEWNTTEPHTALAGGK